MNCGLQLYSVRAAMARDPEQTLARVGEFGIDGVEIWDFQGQHPDDLRRWLDAAGLRVLSLDIDLDEFDADPQPAFRNAETLQTKHLVVPWLPPSRSGVTTAGYARRLQAAASVAQRAGFELGFHLHAEEYDRADDASVLAERLVADAHPLFLQLDLGWAWIARRDLSELLRLAADRSPIVHLKDFAEVTDHTSFTSLGEGSVPFGPALHAGRGIEWIVAEQDDRFVPDDMSAAGRSCRALLALRDQLATAA
jgi:sugar phosphate isomerase/epimerase